MAWHQYKSHKIVRAAPIIAVSTDGTTLLVLGDNGEEVFTPTVADMVKKAAIDDYAVVYDNDYCSVSPKAVFEDGYSMLTITADC